MDGTTAMQQNGSTCKEKIAEAQERLFCEKLVTLCTISWKDHLCGAGVCQHTISNLALISVSLHVISIYIQGNTYM